MSILSKNNFDYRITINGDTISFENESGERIDRIIEPWIWEVELSNLITHLNESLYYARLCGKLEK
jgi:hypothetical protein